MASVINEIVAHDKCVSFVGGKNLDFSIDNDDDDCQDDEALLVKIHGELMNMGQALKCPLCLHTLKDVPVLTVCGHAFCRECLSHCCDSRHQWWCPVCKVPMKNKKRGWTKATALSDLVKAYKLGLRAFGMTPIVYTEGLTMTQLPLADDEDAQEPSLQACHEHLEVSRKIHKALQQHLPKDLPNEKLKMQNLVQDQQRVIQEDERALVRAAVAKKKRPSATDDSNLLLHDGNTVIHDNNDSTVILHDGNTLLESCSQEQTMMELSRDQEAADRSAEDNELSLQAQEEQIFLSAQEQISSQLPSQKIIEKQSALGETVSKPQSINESSDQKVKNTETNSVSNRPTSPQQDQLITPTKETFNSKDAELVVGSIVRVQSRTWAGINKPGGVGRITKVCTDSHISTYNIKYVLGGSEKRVDGAFIQLESSNSSPQRTSRKRDIYSPSHSQKRTKTSFAYHGKKKSKAETPSHIPQVDVPIPTTEVQENITKPTTPEKKTLQQIASSTKPIEDKKVIHVVTSSLSDYDQNMMNILISESNSWKDLSSAIFRPSDNSLTLKIDRDLKLNQTDLCVTSSQKSGTVISSKLRTLKVMKAALSRIPIVSSSWISTCLSKQKIIIDDESFFISTLPSKTQPYDYGVLALAAAKDKLLLDVHVYLCGSWKAKAKKDIFSLLELTGATLLTNASTAVNALSKSKSIVLLCEESCSTDKQSGITQSLVKAVKQKGENVRIVSSSWLFDCITCAQQLSPTKYPPMIPKAATLVRDLH